MLGTFHASVCNPLFSGPVRIVSAKVSFLLQTRLKGPFLFQISHQNPSFFFGKIVVMNVMVVFIPIQSQAAPEHTPFLLSSDESTILDSPRKVLDFLRPFSVRRSPV